MRGRHLASSLAATNFAFGRGHDTSNDLSGGLILRLRLTIRNGGRLRDRPVRAPPQCQKTEYLFE
jgi:hypothetical protein